jgi:hypothetical protein
MPFIVSLLCAPVIREKGETIRYPHECRNIPLERIGYLYYAGRIWHGERIVGVVIRRPCKTHLMSRLELFADRNLREALMVSDGDLVRLEVDEEYS